MTGRNGVSAKAPDVFVAYASDASDFCKKLVSRLEVQRFAVFFDRRALEPGLSYDDKLEDAVKSCGVFIFIVSPRSTAKNAYSLTELEWASGRRTLTVFAPGHETVSAPPQLAATTYVSTEGDVTANVFSRVRAILGLPRDVRASRLRLAAGIGGLAIVLSVAASYGLARKARSEPALAVTAAQPIKSSPGCPPGMILVQGGDFQMGTGDEEAARNACLGASGESGDDAVCAEQARRQRRRFDGMSVGSFCLDAFEVSNGDFVKWAGTHEASVERVQCGSLVYEFARMGDERIVMVSSRTLEVRNGRINSAGPQVAERAVAGVTWRGANDFCAASGKRLPNEVEWEYAARGPRSLEYVGGGPPACESVVFGRSPEGASSLPKAECPGGTHHAEASRATSDKSWAGVFGMAGNVSEWTSTVAPEKCPNGGTCYVVKGGGWEDPGAWTRPAVVMIASDECPWRTVGFRCASSVISADSAVKP